jgi:hypothetical protein
VRQNDSLMNWIAPLRQSPPIRLVSHNLRLEYGAPYSTGSPITSYFAQQTKPSKFWPWRTARGVRVSGTHELAADTAATMYDKPVYLGFVGQ